LETMGSAQLDALEMFALEHCEGEAGALHADVCFELRRQVAALERQAADPHEGKGEGGGMKHRGHEKDIFGVDASSVRPVARADAVVGRVACCTSQ
jgi:hypothetical protein